MTSKRLTVVDTYEITAHSHCGGEMRPVLSPSSAGSTTGFMGTGRIAVGDWVDEHYHPYSEEFLYILSGEATAEINEETYVIGGEQGIVIPIGLRHRVSNRGSEEVRFIYHLGPLAPSPEEGHVTTEKRTRR